ncbi:MAG: alternative ribosome rescue factor ArfA [Psychromonas sp.]
MGKKHKKHAAFNSTCNVKSQTNKATELGRGTINHSAMAALVTSKVFSMRVEKAKKGKGSFNRKAKHSHKEAYQIAA